MRPERSSHRPPPGRASSRPTRTPGPSRKRERPSCRPGSQHIGTVSAEQKSLPTSVRRLGTESKPNKRVCVLVLGLNATASARATGSGDGLQPHQPPRAHRAPDRSVDRLHRVLSAQPRIFRARGRCGPMSHAALAAVLRLEDISAGERLAAFSLASFANREHRAWPRTPVAAARAGLSRSQYLAARDGLARRGLVEVDEPGGGRGRSPVVSLRFAESGPWCDVEVNPGLVEAVLSYSRTCGSPRVLLLTAAGGGRARTNHWSIPHPRSINPEPVAPSRPRPVPGAGAPSRSCNVAAPTAGRSS
jgi:hypothetical protein